METTTTADQVSTTMPSPDYGLVWGRAPGGGGPLGGPGDQEILDAAAGGPGLVAVGYDASGGDWDAAVWTSTDGSNWSRVSHDEAVFGGSGDQAMYGVTAGGPGLVAVGYDGASGSRVAAVWISRDGSSWSRVAHEEAVFGGADERVMWAVTAGGPGLVAVGADSPQGDWDPAVWTSADGLAWSPVTRPLFRRAESQEMWRVVAGGPGLVALGYDDAAGNRDGAVWTSVDGLVWDRVPPRALREPGDQEMCGLAAGGPGLVIVGYDHSGGDWDGAVWASADGLAWTRVAHDEGVFGGPGDQRICGVAVGAIVVAVGEDGSGGDLDGAVWTSADGLTWNRVTHDEAALGGPGDQSMTVVIDRGEGLVAMGWVAAEGGSNAGAWVSPG